MLGMLDTLTDDPIEGIERFDETLRHEIYSRQDLTDRQKERLYRVESKSMMAKFVAVFAERLKEIRINTIVVRCKGCTKPECQFQKI